MISEKAIKEVRELREHDEEMAKQAEESRDEIIKEHAQEMLEALEGIIGGLAHFPQDDGVPWGFAMPIMKAKELINKIKEVK